eukprot:TRINITY_DN11943_c0_g1_i5.p1 TRINITY_DN11943_c0_g1~~TRINITY_DN11943_c0_g1_i5.p1  ORF type:complete len:174 (+),score=22.16 TRINITY_DN11943_c0_g1_i5:155-676(+)
MQSVSALSIMSVFLAVNYCLCIGLGPTLTKIMRSTVKTLREYVEFPGLKGCQVKLLTGAGCAENITVTEDRIQLAMKRLEEIAFLGLTDEYDASICLFHAMYGGTPKLVEFSNIRPTTNFMKGGQVYDAEKVDELSPEDDPADWRLYQRAKEIFRQRQRQYGLPALVAKKNVL